MQGPKVIFEANNGARWFVVDDVVMGGMSDGRVTYMDDGLLHFYGLVSTANNGGFSSIRMRPGSVELDEVEAFEIKLKGDGKAFQFRVKSDEYQRYSYAYTFKTSGEWEVIRIPFKEMQATFRGRKVDVPPYPGKKIDEVAFLIGNKINESFDLIVERIEVR
jgi:NADH dehydrogenase [ubiquinone] 1 alpha subcomplex assembly factor 1